jgi:hypothetical protein
MLVPYTKPALSFAEQIISLEVKEQKQNEPYGSYLNLKLTASVIPQSALSESKIL